MGGKGRTGCTPRSRTPRPVACRCVPAPESRSLPQCRQRIDVPTIASEEADEKRRAGAPGGYGAPLPTEPRRAPKQPAPPPAHPAHPAQPAEGDAAEGVLPADRVAELRDRIRGGAYDTSGAADEVARRILAGGDA